MYKMLIILSLFFSLPVFSQDQSSIAELKRSFAALSYEDFQFKVTYIEEKETLYFEIIKSEKSINAYKLLIKDVHPKGIFLIENNDRYTIRVLSLHNGYVFIKENFGKKYRHSNTTNFVDIGFWDSSYKSDLVKFIYDFEQFISSKTSSNTNSDDDDEIIIITNKKH